MRSLTATDLHYLRATSSLHGLGRIAVNPASGIAHKIQSFHGGCGARFGFQYTPKGLDIWTTGPRTAAADHHIPWSAVRGHITRYVTDDFRTRFVDLDHRWCVLHTTGHADTAREIERELNALSATVWATETTLDTQPEQLDLFA